MISLAIFPETLKTPGFQRSELKESDQSISSIWICEKKKVFESLLSTITLQQTKFFIKNQENWKQFHPNKKGFQH